MLASRETIRGEFNKMILYRLILAAVVGLILASGALAQARQLITGSVVSSEASGGIYVVELDEQNACGSYMYVASTQEMIDITQAAIAEMGQYEDGLLTLKVEGCAAGSAVIVGAAGGPNIL